MKIRILLIVLACGLLSGCSIFGEINQSLDYANEATKYIANAASFAEQVPNLTEQALADPQARASLIQSLETMKNNAIHFNGLEVPAVVKDIHQQLVGYNETLLSEINGYLGNISDNVFNLNTLAESQIMQTIEKITQTLNLIQQLG